jgi:Tfp pilus assembly protein PilN
MIKINLAQRKRSQAGAIKAPTSGQPLSLGNLLAQLEEFRDLPIRQMAVPLVIGIVVTFGFSTYKQSEIDKLQQQIQALQAEKPKLQAEADKMAGYEELQKQMEKDELVIRTKIDTIRKLVQGRTTTVRLLTEISKITPAHLWLTSVDIGTKEISFKGYSSDFSLISDFMKTLNDNTYVRDVTLKDTQMAEDENHREVAKFELLAKER